MSRAAAGAALRALREARDWSLADLAAATGVSIMGLSYLERGARKPHKTTVRKLENGLGLPPGTYVRLSAADDPAAELDALLAAVPADAGPAGTVQGASAAGAGPIGGPQSAEVLAAHAEAHVESLKTLMARLPAETSNEYETYIQSVIAQCVKAEMLAASSWRVAVMADGGSAGRLMDHLKALDEIRTGLLARLPTSIGACLDRACAGSGLPESVIATLLGVGAEEMWDMRNRGVVPPGVLPRVRAFVAGEP